MENGELRMDGKDTAVGPNIVRLVDDLIIFHFSFSIFQLFKFL